MILLAHIIGWSILVTMFIVALGGFIALLTIDRDARNFFLGILGFVAFWAIFFLAFYLISLPSHP